MNKQIQLYQEIECPDCSGLGNMPSNTLDCDIQDCRTCKGDGYITKKIELVTLKQLKKMLEEV